MGGVIVRLEVDHMRESILHFFADHSAEIQEQLQGRLNEAIKSFNWDKEVSSAFDYCLKDTIRNAIKAAIDKSFRSDEITGHLEGIARSAIYKYTREA